MSIQHSQEGVTAIELMQQLADMWSANKDVLNVDEVTKISRHIAAGVMQVVDTDDASVNPDIFSDDPKIAEHMGKRVLPREVVNQIDDEILALTQLIQLRRQGGAKME